MKTKLSTLFFLFFVLCCNIFSFLPIVYGYSILVSNVGVGYSKYAMWVWDEWILLAYGTTNNLYLRSYNRVTGQTYALNPPLYGGSYAGIGKVGSTVYVYWYYGSGYWERVPFPVLSGVVEVGWGGIAESVYAFSTRSSGGVWFLSSSGVWYITTSSPVRAQTFTVSKGWSVYNAYDMLVYKSGTSVYLWNNGVSIMLNTPTLNAYLSDWDVITVYYKGLLYSAFSQNGVVDGVAGVNIFNVTTGQSIWRGYTTITGQTPPVIVGYDYDDNGIAFIWHKGGSNFLVWNSIDKTFILTDLDVPANNGISMWLGEIFCAKDTSNYWNLYKSDSNLMKNGIIWFPTPTYTFSTTVKLQNPSFPILSNSTVTFTVTATRSGLPLNYIRGSLYVNDSFVDTRSTNTGNLAIDYVLPYIEGYPEGYTVNLNIKLHIHDNQLGYYIGCYSYNISYTNSVHSLTDLFGDPNYIFMVQLLNPTTPYVINYPYQWLVRLKRVDEQQEDRRISVTINGVTTANLHLYTVNEILYNITFKKLGLHVITFTAYNSSNVKVGVKCWYIYVNGSYTPPPEKPQQPQPPPPLIEYSTFGNVLIILLLLLTPIFIFARIGFAGILVGGIIGLILCYVAGLIQLWMIVLAGIGIIALIFFGYKGGG